MAGKHGDEAGPSARRATAGKEPPKSEMTDDPRSRGRQTRRMRAIVETRSTEPRISAEPNPHKKTPEREQLMTTRNEQQAMRPTRRDPRGPTCGKFSRKGRPAAEATRIQK